MKTLTKIFAVAALSVAALAAVTDDSFFAKAEKQIKKGNDNYFKALGSLGKLKPEFLMSSETKAALIQLGEAEVKTQKEAQGKVTWSSLGKFEVLMTISAGMWFAAKLWQTFHYTPKEVTVVDPNTKVETKVKTFEDRPLALKGDVVADWALVSSNGMLAAYELYKASVQLTKKKESLKNAEAVLSAIKKLPVKEEIIVPAIEAPVARVEPTFAKQAPVYEYETLDLPAAAEEIMVQS
jgi:hypothetical protein